MANEAIAGGRNQSALVQEMKTLTSNVGSDGFVKFLDIMGDDKEIVNAARISYHLNDKSGNKMVKGDRELLRYLMRNHHDTPYEMIDLKFYVRCPMDVWRQWIRHRAAHVNEYSTRYSVAIDSMATTNPDEWRLQDAKNKQGSDGFISEDVGRRLCEKEEDLQRVSRRVYEDRLKAGVAREQSRKDLPLSTYTEAIWKIDLRNLLNFLRLRLDEHAQKEIREFAKAIAFYVEQLLPVTWEAFVDYTLNSITLSREEAETVFLITNGDDRDIDEWGGTIYNKFKGSERREFIHKLRHLFPRHMIDNQLLLAIESEAVHGDARGEPASESSVDTSMKTAGIVRTHVGA